MGQMENSARKRARRRNLSRAILGVVQASGIIAVGLVAPNMPKALQKLGMLPTGGKDIGSINRARQRLIVQGYLERSSTGFLRLTKKGEMRLERLALTEPLERPRRWDGRWRVLIFDIPERKKTVRERLRAMLFTSGFVRLQDSVWVFPHDCEDFVALLKTDLKIGKEMLYLIVDEMEGDSPVRRRFGI